MWVAVLECEAAPWPGAASALTERSQPCPKCASPNMPESSCADCKRYIYRCETCGTYYANPWST